jgi:dihydropteroate synthase
MKYLLKFATKRDLRLLLRYNYTKHITRSSLYKIENTNYVLLISEEVLDFPHYISIEQIITKTNSEQYLFEWAGHEISQSVDYIKFESNAVLSKASRRFDGVGVSIYRCFAALADIFAILNYTANSFSDGGKFNNVDSVLQRISYHYQMGAGIIDLGVEATSPRVVNPLRADDEIKLLKQILPHVLELKGELKFELSIDSYHPETIRWLLDFDIDIFNDVSGSISLDLVKQILGSNRRYVAMHSLSLPASSRHVLDINISPLEYLSNWQHNKIQGVMASGVDTHNLILDPGIGFGLNPAQSWFVVRHLDKLRGFPYELLLGHSRKIFFNHITDKTFANCDLETAMVASLALPHVDYIRIHDLNMLNQLMPVFGQLG